VYSGQVDIIVEAENGQAKLEDLVFKIAMKLKGKGDPKTLGEVSQIAPTEEDKQLPFNYTRSREMDRPQSQDIIATAFDDYIEMRCVLALIFIHLTF
jgi:hypothetical protein